MSTAIQWTDVTDNIIVAAQGGWWCRRISPGCNNCYAEKLNDSTYFKGNHLKYTGKPPELKLREDVIDGWKRMRKPKRHFVASMTDVFGEWVPWSWALRFLRGMWCAPSQTFQVLTKRPEVAASHITRWLTMDGLREVPENIWLGTSVEDQQRADERIPHLLKIPAKVRFLSVEPLLGPVDLKHIGYGAVQWDTIHWVIIGGESGPRARPCSVDWIRSIVQQCKEASVPVFVKQLGGRPVETIFDARGGYLGFQRHGEIKDPKGGDMAEWSPDLRVRQFPS